MDVIKAGVVVAAALAVGAGVGAFAVHQRLAPAMNELRDRLALAQGQSAALERQVEELGQHSQRLETQSRALRDQIEGLQRAAAALPPAPQAPPEPPAQDIDETADLEALLSAAAEGRDAAPARPTPDPSELPGAVREPPEQRLARRAEYLEQVRLRTQEIMAEEMDRSADPRVRQRIETLQQYTDYMIDLMDRLREAPDEATRETLQAEFDQVRQTVSQLVREQQDHMLLQLAAQFGIVNGPQQQAFLESLRQTQASPFFRAPLLVWGSSYAAPAE